jgi:nicotinamide phosphoribosyltransferase
MDGVTEVVHFGAQMFLRQLDERFDREFFEQPKDQVVADYKRIIKNTLGVANPETKHIEDLHDLGYLPLLIKSLPEGTIVPLRVPTMTVQNTDPKFFWLTNYIETLASCTLWQPATSATIAREYRKILDKAAQATGGDPTFVQFQGHDFSMRGMSSLDSAVASGMGHLLFFTGTDTVPAIQGAEYYYGANVEKELVGTSIPATEHSIQCAYGNDMEYLDNMMSKVHPEGMVSIVSDGYDFWDVMGRVLPALKTKIMSRNGKVVIRPDSGDPVKIICGDLDGKTELERKGAIEVLWDIFGGTTNSKNFKQLYSHIGLIYGDAITLRRADEIVNRLAEKGFASTNVVFGIGSYTYQYNTRDTFGFAMKSTLCVINGEEKQIFKDPKTDNGIKKSLKGRVAVVKSGGTLKAVDQFKLNEDVPGDLLEVVYNGGYLTKETTFGEIRKRVQQ